MKVEQIFKTCPACSKKWKTMEDFVSDPSLELNGYKADFKDLEYGMFFFTHKIEPCHSTMTIMIEDFRKLYSGPIYKENKAFSEECPRYCIDEKNLARCDAFCECAFVREIMEIIVNSKGTAIINQASDGQT